MLDKKDLKDVKTIVQDALQEFFETLILPYFDHNEKDHAEMKAILKSHDKRFNAQDKELDSIQRKLEKNEDDHEEIFKRLDTNDEDHKKMLTRLGSIDFNLQNHEKRIKTLELASVIQ